MHSGLNVYIYTYCRCQLMHACLFACCKHFHPLLTRRRAHKGALGTQRLLGGVTAWELKEKEQFEPYCNLACAWGKVWLSLGGTSCLSPTTRSIYLFIYIIIYIAV